MLSKSLVENEIESAIGERRLEGVTAHQLQVFVKVFAGSKAVYNLEAIFSKIEHVDFGTQARKFSTVATRTGTHFEHLEPLEFKIFLDGVQHGRRRRINLPHVIFPLPKTVPYRLIWFFN